MSEDYVFPQTITKDEKFNRTGGLTKRELFAAIMFAGVSLCDSALAVQWADDLLLELKKKPKKTRKHR